MSNTVPGQVVFANTKSNDYRRWAGKLDDEKTAAFRFGQTTPYFISHKPKFKLSRDEAIFTIGSCFARNVEAKLVKEKIRVLLEGHGVPNERYQRFDKGTGQVAGGISRGAMNKYCTHSIANEIERTVLGLDYPNHGLIEVSDGVWYDPHASMLKPDTYEIGVDTRERIARANAEIFNATTTFITLGLTETWVDIKTGVVLNVPPAPMYLRRHQDRFAFYNADFFDSYEMLERTIKMIREKCRPDMRFIVTVSPVPLGATHTEMDVVTANTYSKSVLRSVAQTLARKYDFIDYYPSFEIVTNSPRALAWQEDQLHVNPELVEHVVSRFVELYFD
jgi:hypothetical protein